LVDFTLTDEQKDLRELAHNFAEREIRPVAWDYDREGTWPQEIIEKAFEVGLMNVHIRRPTADQGSTRFPAA
jgi:acyl-CoA dehydrogenase